MKVFPSTARPTTPLTSLAACTSWASMGAPSEARSGRTPCLSDEQTVVVAGLRLFRADLHVHTALSPCGSEEMTPPSIVAGRAGEKA